MIAYIDRERIRHAVTGPVDTMTPRVAEVTERGGIRGWAGKGL